MTLRIRLWTESGPVVWGSGQVGDVGMLSGALVTTHGRKRMLTEGGELGRRASPQLGRLVPVS